MMSEMSLPLTVRSNGEPLERNSDFRSMTGMPGGRGVVLAQESLLHQDSLRSAAGDDVARFVGLEPRVDRHQHAARGQQPERRDDPLGRVGRPDGDPIALVDSEVSECACGATYSLDKLGECQAQRTVDNRFRVAEAVRRAQDHLGDGLPWWGACHTVTRRPRLPPMIFAWSSTDRCDSALT